MDHRVLFVGGCHVDGSKSDGKTNVARVALRSLSEHGIECEASYLIPARLAHHRRVAQRCQEFRPDLLVLQTGHPETSGLLSAHLKKFVGLAPKTRNIADFNDVYEVFDGSPRVRLKWLVRANVKRLADLLTGHTLVDLPALKPVVDRFYRQVAELGVPAVVVLSPLPCADPVAMYYRRKFAPLLQQACQRYGLAWLDVLETGQSSYFMDPIHLSARGHQAIGGLVADRILSISDLFSARKGVHIQ